MPDEEKLKAGTDLEGECGQGAQSAAGPAGHGCGERPVRGWMREDEAGMSSLRVPRLTRSPPVSAPAAAGDGAALGCRTLVRPRGLLLCSPCLCQQDWCCVKRMVQ